MLGAVVPADDRRRVASRVGHGEGVQQALSAGGGPEVGEAHDGLREEDAVGEVAQRHGRRRRLAHGERVEVQPELQ